MKFSAYSPGDRRAVIVGVATICGLIFVVRGVPALRSWRRDVGRSAQELRGELARAVSNVEMLPAVRDSLAARTERVVGLALSLVGGDTYAAAAAQLASLVSLAVDRATTSLGEIRIVPDTGGAGPFVSVAVRGSLTGDIRGVAAFLRELEGGDALVSIRELDITQREPAAPPEQPEELEMYFLVEALAVLSSRATTQ